MSVNYSFFVHWVNVYGLLKVYGLMYDFINPSFLFTEPPFDKYTYSPICVIGSALSQQVELIDWM